MLTVEKSTIPALFAAPEFPALHDEYAALGNMDGMPAPVAKLETYQRLEDTGALHTFVALLDGALVGFITALATPLPKYDGVPMVTTESFFVASAHRKTGAGLKLLRTLERFAAEIGAGGLLVSAPVEGDLVGVLPRIGYRLTARIFFKKVKPRPPAALPVKRELVVAHAIPPSGGAAIAKVRELEAIALQQPQIPLVTEHVLHGGMYARTVRVPAGVLITGALVKIPTILSIEGDVVVYLDEVPARIAGSHVLPASGGRKQAFLAIADTRITMMFPTDARTVEAAERQFTDEADRLQSRASACNVLVVTGE